MYISQIVAGQRRACGRVPPRKKNKGATICQLLLSNTHVYFRNITKDILNIKYDDVKIDLIMSVLGLLNADDLEMVEVKVGRERRQDQREDFGLIEKDENFTYTQLELPFPRGL